MDLRKVLKTGDIVPHFQPLIRLATGDRLGYEVLARSHCRGLRGASVLFLAAQGLGLEAELSDLCRREGVRQGKSLPGRPTLFFNTHVTELKHPPFLASLREFREQNYVTPIVLEVQERKVDDFRAIRDLRDVSRGYGLQLAFDNVGGEQSRLEQLLELRPDFVKFDISMIHRIHRASPRQQQYLKSLVELTCESGATPVAEGVECPQEAEVCRRLGFVFAQGHHFGRPQCGADITAEQFKEKLARSTGTINLAQTQAVKTLRPLTGRPPETQLVGSANESPALTNP